MFDRTDGIAAAIVKSLAELERLGTAMTRIADAQTRIADMLERSEKEASELRERMFRP